MTIVEAQALLDDLLEVSGQVEAAAIVTRGGEVVASTVAGGDSDVFGASVHSLAASASSVSSPTDEELVQFQVTLADTCVFVAQDAQHVIGCVTVPHPTAGLVFYDLKSTLRRLAGEQDDLVPKPMAWDGEESAEDAK